MDSLNGKRRKHVDVPKIDSHTLDDISSITIDSPASGATDETIRGT